ncbi:MAG: DNA helicase PcrA [Actinobacteria bacterium]|nr:DNA helicase PcrA [Actinomycetota bacterium]
MNAEATPLFTDEADHDADEDADPVEGRPNDATAGWFVGLNADQAEAVTHDEGPLLVVAGAGSGKTRVLTHRIAHLVRERGVSPFAILAITFTNKAAEEMRARVSGLVGPVADRMWVSTFHSACVRILRREAGVLGFPSTFTIYDQLDAIRLTSYVLRDANLDAKRFPPRAVHAAISAAKNELIDPRRYAEQAQSIFDRRIAEVYSEYQIRLARAGAMDFDDLLTWTVSLFRRHPDVLAHYQERFEHVLVDEYQDTNRAQAELVAQLGAEHRNVFVVGDSDQSIYQFRGADVRNILEFERAFPDASVVVLDQNYRSTRTILDAANAVIANNGGRPPKQLWTEEAGGAPISRFTAEDEHQEASWVARELVRFHDREHLRWGDLAVFYRANAQSRVIEESLMRAGVPYRVIGGTRFFDRREIKDTLAYLRALVNPIDDVSLERALLVPRRGVGDTTINKLREWARETGSSLRAALGEAAAIGVRGRALEGISTFLALLVELDAMVETGATPSVVLDAILRRSGYLALLEDDGTIEAQSRIENVGELVSMAEQVDDIGAFLDTVTLVADTDQLDADGDGSSVSLMTLHAAKGLEFPVVFLVGMEEGVFPHQRALTDPHQLEEERRLAYVGITRARRHLLMSSAWSRMLFGVTQYNPPSRFLDEIPESLVRQVGGTGQVGSAGSTGHRSSGRRSSGGHSSSGMGSRDDDTDGYIWGGQSRQGPRTGDHRRQPEHPEQPSPGTGAELLGLEVGDHVRHDTWGQGVVLEAKGEGDRAEALVRFQHAGERRLLLCMAPLHRLDDPSTVDSIA